ncbi:DUF5666 domain-containing protein [Streptomyces sp. NPDC059533]|uniref:DUF5666 domain-containing protein n=1 Tax=unclassified Streptomyces TaxID=2593676 RepID=UPI00367938EB
MTRGRTGPEKEPPEVTGDPSTPFADAFEDVARADRSAEAPGPSEDPEAILSEPPDTRDVSAELAAPPRPRLPWLTLLLSGGVVAGLAFTGGVLVEKGHLQGSGGSGVAASGRGPGSGAGGQGRTGFGQGGQSQGQGQGQSQGQGQGQGSAGQGRTGNGQNGSRQGFGGSNGGLGAGAGLTTGTVKLVDGATLYVTDAQGNVVKVTTDTNTQITESRSGKVSDLQPGQTVTVRGSRSPSGDVTATAVAQGGGGGFGGGRG